MTRYTVVWHPDLAAEFTTVWLHSDSAMRAALTHASHWADVNLPASADQIGRPLESLPYRVVLVPGPKGCHVEIVFEVVPADRQVRIIRFTPRKTDG